MHEGSLMRDLLRKIAAVAHIQGARRVTGVTVRLGALSHISPDHLRDYFTYETDGTVAEGARLDIDVMTETDDPNAQEIILHSIDVED